MFREIVCVGCGGIFSKLWHFLGQSCHNQAKAPKKITLIDGDTFEAKNLDRQDLRDMDVGHPKSEVFRNRMLASFNALDVNAVTEYVTSANIKRLIPDNAIILMMVDHDPVRNLISEYMSGQLKNVTLIEGSNFGLNDAQPATVGNAYWYLRLGGEDITLPLHEAYPKIKEAKGQKTKGEMNCNEREALPGGQQLGATNFMVAAWMGAYLSTLIERMGTKEELVKSAVRNSEVVFDIARFTANRYGRAKQKTATQV